MADKKGGQRILPRRREKKTRYFITATGEVNGADMGGKRGKTPPV